MLTAHDGLGGEAFHLYFHIEQLNTIKFLFTCGQVAAWDDKLVAAPEPSASLTDTVPSVHDEDSVDHWAGEVLRIGDAQVERAERETHVREGPSHADGEGPRSEGAADAGTGGGGGARRCFARCGREGAWCTHFAAFGATKTDQIKLNQI